LSAIRTHPERAPARDALVLAPHDNPGGHDHVPRGRGASALASGTGLGPRERAGRQRTDNATGAVRAMRASARARSPIHQLDGVCFGTALVVVVDGAIRRASGMPRQGDGGLASPQDTRPRLNGTDKISRAILATICAPGPRDIREDMAQRRDRGTAAVRAAVRRWRGFREWLSCV
jgi:hypothetical protein